MGASGAFVDVGLGAPLPAGEPAAMDDQGAASPIWTSTDGDVYAFAADAAAPTRIENFAVGPAGDVLDVAALIERFDPQQADDAIRFVQVADGAVLQVDCDAASDAAGFEDVALLAGLSAAVLEVDALLASDNRVATYG